MQEALRWLGAAFYFVSQAAPSSLCHCVIPRKARGGCLIIYQAHADQLAIPISKLQSALLP
jgi:hypothetical protein